MLFEFDLEQLIKPEPAIPEELEAKDGIKQGEYEIYSEKLNNICLEAREVFVRTGISSMLHSGDLVVGIYTSRGDMVTSSCGTYLHSVTGQIPIKYILHKWKDNPTVGIREGDIFYCNEATLGGIHNPDQMAIMPIFFQGELLAWSVAATHQPETGACEPGGMPVSAQSRYDEGMKLSPIKIGENYRIREDLLEMTANMIGRAERMQVVDVRARATGADRLRVRLQELAQKKGATFLKGLFIKMIDDTAEAVGKRIKNWNDGTYRHVVFMDTVGLSHSLVRLCLTVIKKGERITMDFNGTSPENESSYHQFLHIVRAHAAVYLYQFPFHDFPISSGTFVPFSFLAPQGCALNASPDAAVSNSPIIGAHVFELICITFAKMMFDSEQRDLVSGFCSASAAPNMFAGINQWGVPVADIMAFTLNTFGYGARHDLDGIDACGFAFGPWGKAPDAEDTEMEQPHFILFEKFWRDSGGFGKYRGGNGTEVAFVLSGVPAFAYMSSCLESKAHSHASLFGAYPSPPHPGISVKKTNILDKLRANDADLPQDVPELVGQKAIQGNYVIESAARPTRLLEKGDVWIVNSPAGGGYGDVLQRDPEAVIDDLRQKLISGWVAENIFKVKFDQHTLQVDYEQTRELREAERQSRRQRGLSYSEFERQWLSQKPPEEALAYYGTWPEAERNRPLMRF